MIVRFILLPLYFLLPLQLMAMETPKDCTNNTVGLTKAFPQLPHLAAPIAMVQPKNDSSFWFVALRDGQIASFANQREVSEVAIVLDIREKVNTKVEMGLTSIAFHPNYPDDNRLFVSYNDLNQKNRTTLASFEVDATTKSIDPKSETLILSVKKNALFHVAGHLVFGPDGYLYAGFGDDGYTPHFAQDTENLHGSIIRIDIDKEPYGIPKDNPFNKDQSLCREGENTQTCPEIFAYGFRNPWRFSFDSQTRVLWQGDVGEDSFEEINLVNSGENYGWPTKEGHECFDAWLCFSWGMIPPHNGYDQEGGQSIVGGYVYRGKEIESLFGQYVFGDIYSQKFFALDAKSSESAPFKYLFNANFMVASMARGNDESLYLLNFEGQEQGQHIHKITSICQSPSP